MTSGAIATGLRSLSDRNVTTYIVTIFMHHLKQLTDKSIGFMQQRGSNNHINLNSTNIETQVLNLHGIRMIQRLPIFKNRNLNPKTTISYGDERGTEEGLNFRKEYNAVTYVFRYSILFLRIRYLTGSTLYHLYYFCIFYMSLPQLWIHK